MPEAIFGLAVAVLAVTAVSGKVERTVVTIPMLVVGAGVVSGWLFDVELDLSRGAILFLEITLALVLFSDASRIDLASLRSEEAWPRRMLGIGLPLAILLGGVLAGLVLGLDPGWALLLGVILAPTDAALAEPVLTTGELPQRIRQTLNVESGLNDGLALPALFVAVAIIEAGEGITAGDVVGLFAVQLGLGVAFGIGFGLIGAWVVGQGLRSGWMSGSYQKIATLALAFATFGATQWVGASGFVATFVAGMVFSSRCRPMRKGLFEFAQNEASALVLVAFLVLGAGPVRLILQDPPGWEIWMVALASLLMVRPVAVMVSMIGTGAMRPTRLFLGWFGPRGLATIVFLLTAIEETMDIPDSVTETVVLTIGLSVLLHGLTAYPASMALVHKLDAMHETEADVMAEMVEVAELPMRVARPPES